MAYAPTDRWDRNRQIYNASGARSHPPDASFYRGPSRRGKTDTLSKHAHLREESALALKRVTAIAEKPVAAKPTGKKAVAKRVAGGRTVARKPALEEPWKAFQVRHRSMERKRDAVVKTAAHLFLEHGYQKTTMSLLAARLKITKPALYYYFRNKEEILVECYRTGIAEIESNLGRLSKDAGSGFARLQLYVLAYATVVLTHEFGRCVAMIDDSELSLETRRGVRDLKRRIDGSFRRLVLEGIDDGSIVVCNPKLVTFAIAGAINWAGTWYKPSGDLFPEEIAAAFAEILTGGLSARGKRKAC